MKYQVEDGTGEVDASDPTELVTRLKADGRFTAGQTNQEYMKRFATRYADFYGRQPPRSDSEENFVADLIAQGYLKQIPDKG